ncbi:hypothetical protein Btru_038065 [Bulinus truncatus]|nr:hypothetical protein Btru_038065 [Bulinus truncatus]
MSSLYDLSAGPSNNVTRHGIWTEKFQGGIVIAQNIFHLYFVIFLAIISMSLVHWQDHIWQRLLAQVVFCVIDVYVRQVCLACHYSCQMLNQLFGC